MIVRHISVKTNRRNTAISEWLIILAASQLFAVKLSKLDWTGPSKAFMPAVKPQTC